MAKLRQLLSDLQSWFSRLTERERVLVGTAGAAVAVLAILAILYTFSSRAAEYRKHTDDKLAQLAEAMTLAASYADAERGRQEVERQLSSSDVSLITYLEEKGQQAGLRIPTMNPKGDIPLGDGRIVESSVELTMTDVSLRGLHQFLTSVESGPGVVKVKYIRLEPRPDNQTLTAWATIATYRLKP